MCLFQKARKCVYSPDDKYIAVVAFTTLTLWSTETYTCVKTIETEEEITLIDWCCNGKCLIFVIGERRFQVWDSATWNRVATIDSPV